MSVDQQVPATLPPLRDIVDDYNAKREAAQENIDAFKRAVAEMELNATIAGTYVPGGLWGRGRADIPSEREVTRSLLKSAWRYVYAGLNIGKIGSAKDRKRFEMMFEDPPEFTLGNIRANFGEFLLDPRHHILKGLAECFTELDPAYKSHSKVKIGVAGLPKRIIIPNSMGQFSYGSWGRERLIDAMNALQTYRGLPRLEYRETADIIDEARKRGEADCPAGRLKAYRNGNAHLIFDKDSLRDINLALAEFYGEVLPDAPEDDAPPDLFRSRAVAKDLQFYWTPEDVVQRAIAGETIRDGDTVLEPSCGDGRIMDVIREKARARMTGVEVDPGRAEEARAKGHAVMTHNFLETAPDPRFDFVVMNPPFYGTHWKKHLLHARKFLRPVNREAREWGGRLICILPATAFWDGHLGKMGLCKPDAHTSERGHIDSGWTDLPVGSFAAAGTNVPTGFFKIGPE